MTTLFLIRHADTDYVGKKLAGWTPGVHLNEKGHEQAEALAARLRPVPFDAVYSSPLERAVETARPVAKARGLRVRKHEMLGEVQYGAWTGRSLRSLSRTKLWRVVQLSPSHMRFPEGDALREVQQRIVGAVEAICREYPKGTVAAFAHGDPIRLAVAYYLGLALDLFQRIQIGTASVTVFQLSPGYTRLVRLNDTGPFEMKQPRRASRKR